MDMFWSLAGEVGKLFLMMLIGFVVYRLGIITVEENKILSKMMLYIVLPAVVLHSFMVEFTPDKTRGLLLSYAAALGVSLVLVAAVTLLKRPLHLTPVESMSVIYFNTGIAVPIVGAAIGQEWVVYATAMICVHTFLVWTHCKFTLSGERTVSWKKLFLNPNMISMLIGIALFTLQLPVPAVVSGTVEGMADLFGPLSMVVTGILIGSLSWERVRSYRRLPLVVGLRMVACPLAALLLVKALHLAQMAPDGSLILTAALLSVATNSGSTITQMVQVYGGDAEYSSVICAVTSLLSMAALPLFGQMVRIL